MIRPFSERHPSLVLLVGRPSQKTLHSAGLANISVTSAAWYELLPSHTF
jgi:hypothetical protein